MPQCNQQQNVTYKMRIARHSCQTTGKTVEHGNSSPIIVIFSGGQDSTTCLIQLLQHYKPQRIHCLTFHYGQRHQQEVQIAQQITTTLKIKTHRVFTVDLIQQLTYSSLTHAALPIPTTLTNGIPTTFIPGRNILFLTLALMYAYQIGAQKVVTGVCEIDSSGYPDCRADFIQALNHATDLGLGRQISIETPLMALNKAEIWALADYYGHLTFVQQQTLSCYHGIVGSGCGTCPACHLRNTGLHYYQNHTTEVVANLKTKVVLI